ncbi:hypothetical protein ACJRO7_023569 [Eucalyptus globulus]|uniref:Uncharacterized protein n=1 Tax=Eucalyptus globulus TaxID=34317 RepID=A0ABD3K957_EUCGL
MAEYNSSISSTNYTASFVGTTELRSSYWLSSFLFPPHLSSGVLRQFTAGLCKKPARDGHGDGTRCCDSSEHSMRFQTLSAAEISNSKNFKVIRSGAGMAPLHGNNCEKPTKGMNKWPSGFSLLSQISKWARGFRNSWVTYTRVSAVVRSRNETVLSS